ncbi:MAG TPA: hypothetical protein VFT46_05485 [Holophagaceae bacterium]|nr:hypothetical protein [Holophagaceae bacterium]
MPSPQDVLNQLRIASPCPAVWAEMVGDDRARFCAACEKHVYDFSKMTAAEGLALIREKEGQVCARLWRRADGTVITADCAVGRRLSARRSVAGPLAAAALLAAALAQAACAPKVRMAGAPLPPSPSPHSGTTATTTYDDTGPVPSATVTLTDRQPGVDTSEVGNLANYSILPFLPERVDPPASGVHYPDAFWERLPLD